MFIYEFICYLVLCLGAFNVMSAGGFFFITFAIRNILSIFFIEKQDNSFSIDYERLYKKVDYLVTCCNKQEFYKDKE